MLCHGLFAFSIAENRLTIFVNTAAQSHSNNSNNKSWYQRNRFAITPWLFLAPALIFFTLYVIAPIFQSIWISFFEWDGLGEKKWVGGANYVELVDDERFYTSLKNNLWWLVLYMLADSRR